MHSNAAPLTEILEFANCFRLTSGWPFIFLRQTVQYNVSLFYCLPLVSCLVCEIYYISRPSLLYLIVAHHFY